MPTNADFAALSELVYRRGDGEQALTLSELGFSAASTVISNAALQTTLTNAGFQFGADGHSFGHFSGLTGSIVTSASGEIIIVFRGSDGTNDGVAGLARGVLSGSKDARPLLQDAGAGADFGDWFSNAALGGGTYGEPGDPGDSRFATNQWRVAKILIEAVQEASAGKEILVTGQSLGGGLAGLAAATYGLSGAGFGAAPFDRQLDIEGDVIAVANVTAGREGAVSEAYNEFFASGFDDLSADEFLANRRRQTRAYASGAIEAGG